MEFKTMKFSTETIIDISVFLLGDSNHIFIGQEFDISNFILNVEFNLEILFLPVQHCNMPFASCHGHEVTISSVINIVKTIKQVQIKCLCCSFKKLLGLKNYSIDVLNGHHRQKILLTESKQVFSFISFNVTMIMNLIKKMGKVGTLRILSRGDRFGEGFCNNHSCFFQWIWSRLWASCHGPNGPWSIFLLPLLALK